MALMPGFNELILIQMMAVVAELKHGRGWSLNLRLGEREHLFDGGAGFGSQIGSYFPGS